MELDSPDMALPKIDKLSCRACLRSGGIGIMHSFTDTADVGSDGEKELRELYKKITNIDVRTLNTKKPTLLCGSCTNKLINAYEFILDAQKAEDLLSFHFKESRNEHSVDQDSNEFNIEIVTTAKPEIQDYKVEFLNAETITADLETNAGFQNFESDENDAIVNEVELNCELIDEEQNDSTFAEQNDETTDGKSFSDIELLDDNEIEEEISSDVADNTTTRKLGAIGSRLSSGPRHQINCDECQRGFAKLETYQRHKEIAHTFAPREEIFAKQTNEQNILCPFCPRTFVHKNDLVRHVNAIHPKDAAKNPIDVEPKTQKRQYKKATCPHCQKDFPQASIKIHIRRHLGINPYKCDTCEKAFPRKQDLTVHIRQHTGEKPYVCSVCAKSFIRPNKLSRHMRIHLGIRDFNCDDCGKSFSQDPGVSNSAIRSRKFIANLKETGKYEEWKKKRSVAMREYREKYKAAESKLPAKESNELREKRRKGNQEAKQRHKEKMEKLALTDKKTQELLVMRRRAHRDKIRIQRQLKKIEEFQNSQSLKLNKRENICIKEEHFDD